MHGQVSSTKASTADGSSRTPASGSRCSSTPVSASRRSNLHRALTSGFERGNPISSSRWCWRPSGRRLLAMCQYRAGPRISLTTPRETDMPDEVTYYAVVDDLSSRERPAGVFRRTYTEDGGRSDEAFTRNLIWEFSPLLISAERGDLQNDFIEITENEANQIVARIRARVTGQSAAKDA